MINQKYVYHASKTSGLTRLEPRSSTHKVPWVYATKSIASSAMFLGDNFDFICQTGIHKGQPYIWERFEGAFDRGYKGESGSIYYLKSDSFKEGLTSFSAEVVSGILVKVEREKIVEDVKTYLLNLYGEGKLQIFWFPDIPEGFPENKEDIVEKGINWTVDFGEQILEQIEEFHLDVLDRVIKGLSDRGYKFKNEKWVKC